MNLSYIRAVTGLIAVLLLSACAGDEGPSAVTAPANVRAEAVGLSIRVAWDYPEDDGEMAFNVYRATGADGAPFEKLTAEPLPALQRSFDDAQVTAGVLYRYAVSAVGPQGESARVESPTPVELEADPEPPPPGSYRLEVRRGSDSSGTGTVASSPEGILCDNVSGMGCSASFPEGTPVVLAARAGEGSSFAGWSGACSGTSASDCALTLNADTTVTATFRPAQATLNVSTDGPGSVSSIPEGIACGGDCRESYSLGTTVSLQPTPEEGNVFVGWGGACSGSGACSVRLEADQTVTASFETATLPAPVIRTFTASPKPVKAGSEVILRWETENAETLLLSSDAGLEPTDVTGETSFEIRQTEDTRYTLEARNADGSVTASTEVKIGRPPVITDFSADPATIALGETSTLSWTVAGDGPLTLSIDRGVGDVSGESQVTVEPEKLGNTRYKLTATNAFGKDEATVSVAVKRRYLLTVVLGGEQGDGQRVTSQGVGGIVCGTDCQEVFFEGTIVRLAAEPPDDFERWFVCNSPTASIFCATERGPVLELLLDHEKYVFAYFDD